MIHYLKQIVETLSQSQQNLIGDSTRSATSNGAPDFWMLIRSFTEELNRLDPRDFLPAARHNFVVVRSQIRLHAQNAQGNGETALQTAQNASGILESYGGEGSQAETKEFNFINDADLKTIVERDYKELSLKLFPDGAWKSCVIMAGSILEAILFDQLENNSTNRTAAMASPKRPTTSPNQIDRWSLASMIEVAADIGVLNSARAESIDQVIRDYRNFVHPRKEIRSAHPCSDAEAMMAKGALDGVYNHLA